MGSHPVRPDSAEAVVIGAGVIGASVAFHLARRGIKPLVIEKHDPAAGSSGACDGLVFLQSKKPGLHLKLALESRQRFEHLKDRLGGGIEFKAPGGMCLIESAAELDAMRRFVEEQRRSGLEVDLIDGEEARRREPCLSDKVIAATWSALDAQVNPYALTFAFLSAAKAAGARVATGEEVKGIDVVSGQAAGVHTSRRRISAPVVVNAAGALAAEVGRMAGLEIPIAPRRGQILVTAAAPPLLRHCLISAQYVAAKFNPELAAGGGMGFSLEQTDSGNILIGSTREFVGFDRRTTFDGVRSIARRIAPVIPALTRVPVIRTFGGLRPYTPDGLPILGKVAGLEGFIMAAGHEGDGIALSAITGELIAELIDKGSTPFPLEAFRLERFHESGL
ncbi:MAG: FAD-binding oxidoreductase [Desulfobacterales bacterium]|jgi:sarcosine oxidase subunit beta|nr:FAD-binding oxidoreductase [Desulfobacterales bacterium]